MVLRKSVYEIVLHCKGSMNMKIIKVIDDEEKKKITRAILEALPEWFGIVEAREEYILDSVGKDFFCAMEKDKVVGFLYLKQTGKDTVELAVMGVLKEYHRKEHYLNTQRKV